MPAEKYDISSEHPQLAESMSKIENLDGYNKLSDYQQRLIKASLYIQERAERGTDYPSKFAIVSPQEYAETEVTRIHTEDHLEYMHKFNSGPDPKDRKYRLSQNAIANWYCHAAIAGLEYEKGLSITPAEVPENFFKTDYHLVASIQNVEKIIENTGFPCVIHIMHHEPVNYNESYNAFHSCLALGLNEEGKVMIWEKKGNQLPFRVVTLDEVYTKYGTYNLWGARPLNKQPSTI